MLQNRSLTTWFCLVSYPGHNILWWLSHNQWVFIYKRYVKISRVLHLMVRLQFWCSRKYWVSLHCYYSQVLSDRNCRTYLGHILEISLIHAPTKALKKQIHEKLWGIRRVYHECGELLELLGFSEICVGLLFLLVLFTCHLIVGWSCKWIKDENPKDRDILKLNFHPTGLQLVFHGEERSSWACLLHRTVKRDLIKS